MASFTPIQTGTVLNNRYRIVKLLGQGGYGAVYRAWDMNFQMACALKENLLTSPEGQRQFLREAQILRSLRHPNLPMVTDTFTRGQQGQYLVMDFVEGEDLQSMLDRVGGPLPEAQVTGWIEQVCDALIYLHGQNPPVIHRDIKPANIRITPAGKAMLVDFGIAKLYDPKAITSTGARAVTPGFSPPEQYGSGKTDELSDIYSLGATLYTLLSGLTPADSIDRMTRQAPPLAPLTALNPAVSSGLSDLAAQALQLEREDRLRNMSQFKARLAPQSKPAAFTVATPAGPQVDRTAALTQAAAAPAIKGMEQKRGRRGWLAYSAAGLVLLLLAVLFFYLKPGQVPRAVAPPVETLTEAARNLARTETARARPPTETIAIAPPVVAPASPTDTEIALPEAVLTEAPASATSKPAESSPSPEPCIRTMWGETKLRTGPGPMYPTYGQLYDDQRLTFIARNQDASWGYVVLENGVEGWVSTSVIVGNDISDCDLPYMEAPPTPTSVPPTRAPATKAPVPTKVRKYPNG